MTSTLAQRPGQPLRPRTSAASAALAAAALAAWVAALGAALAGCAGVPSPVERVDAALPGGDWHSVPLPGKTPTRYAWGHKDGRSAWQAQAERSASMWRMRLPAPTAAPAVVEFSWWVERSVHGASVGDVEREDAPARVLFAFDGDRALLSPRNRMLFDLAAALSGEPPPYATLMYVWEDEAALDSVVVNPRSDRVRKIVVDRGADNLRRWRDHRRDLAADFRRAFGEEPGPLLAVAVMADADNTRGRAQTWFGPIRLIER